VLSNQNSRVHTELSTLQGRFAEVEKMNSNLRSEHDQALETARSKYLTVYSLTTLWLLTSHFKEGHAREVARLQQEHEEAVAAWQVAVDTAAKERDRWSKEAGQLQETVQAEQEKVRAQESRVLDVTRQQNELQARHTVLETTHVQLLRMVDGTDGTTT
jgi:chromosome segregation ATPase